ncbi:vascular cell adhesion protein 1-like [Anableps anableps]
MCASGWPLTLVLMRLIGSATSSPTIRTASHLPSQISSPSLLPTNYPPSSLSFPPPTSTSSTELMAKANCYLQISPSILVVRFGDPATANCSKPDTGSLLGWENTLDSPLYTAESFQVWRVDNMTEWSINPVCFTLSDEGGECSISLSLIVYKPPKTVSIQLLNHSGPMYVRHQYTLQCTVQDVAPIENLVVTFYKGQIPLRQLRSSSTGEKTPVNESFMLLITPCREDNGSWYWCEAKLELGPSGPEHPPAEKSQNLAAMVLWNPEDIDPTKLHMTEEKPLDSEMKNQPLGGKGTTSGYQGCILSIALLVHLIN